MKTLTMTGILSLILVLCMSAGPSKETSATKKLQITSVSTPPSFDFFRTHRQGRGIASNWGLTSYAGVSGFMVKRTYEDPTDPYSVWETIYTSPCNSTRPYRYNDASVLPGLISYQIHAVMNDGTTVVSEILTEQVVSH